MKPGARESDAFLVDLFASGSWGPCRSVIVERNCLRWAREQGEEVLRVMEADSTALGFGALVTGDYGEVSQ